MPEDPVQEGKEFVGWNPEVTQVTGDATYNARFKDPDQYTVEFYADGKVSADFIVKERTKPTTSTYVAPKTGD